MDSKHFKKFGFEYCRIGMIASLKAFGVLLYFKVGSEWKILPRDKFIRTLNKCR